MNVLDLAAQLDRGLEPWRYVHHIYPVRVDLRATIYNHVENVSDDLWERLTGPAEED